MNAIYDFCTPVLGLGVEPKDLTFLQISLRGIIGLEKIRKRLDDCCSKTNETNQKALAQTGVQTHPDFLRVHVLRRGGLIHRG